jgi:hypothetical protein
MTLLPGKTSITSCSPLIWGMMLHSTAVWAQRKDCEQREHCFQLSYPSQSFNWDGIVVVIISDHRKSTWPLHESDFEFSVLIHVWRFYTLTFESDLLELNSACCLLTLSPHTLSRWLARQADRESILLSHIASCLDTSHSHTFNFFFLKVPKQRLSTNQYHIKKWNRILPFKCTVSSSCFWFTFIQN